MSAVRLETFRWWHIDEVLPIEEDLFGAERWTAGMFWNELAAGHRYLVALGDDGRVVGYGGVAIPALGEAWVHNLAVRRDAQRAGIGQSLLYALTGYAAARAAEKVLLEVAADNAAAQKLYAGCGFEVVGVRRGYYQPSNTDALVMRMTLEWRD